MRILFILALLLCSKIALPQLSINGPWIVPKGSTTTYEVNGTPSGAIISWGVGGAISWFGGQNTCEVTWPDEYGLGDLSVTDDIYGYTATYKVLIGGHFITPREQVLNFGQEPEPISVNYAEGQPFFVWEKKNTSGQWVEVQGANLQTLYAVEAGTSVNYYRCRVYINGVEYFSNEATIQYKQFDPGTISALYPTIFKSSPMIITTAASGGPCQSGQYQYSWESSVEGGPWIVIGNTEQYPAGAPIIIGDTKVRRKIVCGSLVAYSNTLEINPQYTFADAENRNYVRVYSIATANINSRYEAADLEIGKKFQETTYFDGLGRNIQTVSKGVSKLGQDWGDMVSFTRFDNLGRATKANLPFPTISNPGKFKTDLTEQLTFYTTGYNEVEPWAKIDFEESPGGRVKKIFEASAQQHQNDIGATIKYDFNNSNNINEGVRIWNIGYEVNALPMSGTAATYPAGVLVKNLTENAEKKKIIEYRDLAGNLILSKVQVADEAPALTNEHAGWLCTYYVYDDFNKLRYVITPKAVKYLEANNWILPANIAAELCYSYEYDERDRIIAKTTPGAGKQSFIYDIRNRVLFTQDAKQAAKTQKEWLANLYDEQDRVTITGIYKTNQTPDQLQAAVDAMVQSGQLIIPAGSAIADLVIAERILNSAPSVYVATNSIELVPEFESALNDEFELIIDPLASTGSTVIPTLLTGNSIVSPENTAVFTALTYHYYDDYSFAGVKAFNTATSNLQAYGSGVEDIDAILTTNRTTGQVTGSKVRILGTEKWLFTTVYYDNKGRTLQALSDNVKNKTDIVTTQYHYTGRVMSEETIHGAENSFLDGYSILKKNYYDKIGNLISLEIKYGNNAFKKIASYDYDEFNRLKVKELGEKAGSPGTPLETQQFSYSARGALTGINRDYALSTNNQDQWNNFFGIYLGYENSDNRFVKARYDRLLTGLIWKSQGDNATRKYDFTYDNAGRLTGADFNQRLNPSDLTWSKAKADFSESGITYDENDNIKTLSRKGITPASAAPVYIDKLEYSYLQVGGGEWSNKLLKVFDNNPETGATANGLAGDFKDEGWGINSDDYGYDEIGNVVIDNNKKIRVGSAHGIVYNVLNKIEKITLENKMVIEFTYDASGNKLSRKLIPVNGTARTTYYVGELLYAENNPEFILHEEGRIRIMEPVNSSTTSGVAGQIKNGNVQLVTGKWGVYDYFLKDHLGSTRMVITEEYHKEFYKASAEDAVSAEEEALFGKVDPNTGAPLHPGNELYDTRFDLPLGTWTNNTSAKVMKLFSTGSPGGKSIGANMLLKVMAGDMINASSKYYFDVPASEPVHRNILSMIVSTLIGGFTGDGVTDAVKSGSGYIQNTLSDAGGPLGSFLGSRPSTQGLKPRAYLNYLFFDENFNYAGEASGAAVVGLNGNEGDVIADHLKAPQNGYVYVFLSNDSEWPVFFDDFTVTHERSAIIEESHYYPHGLKIAGISSRAFDKPANRYAFQGAYSEEEEEAALNLYDLRSYDAQTGRWLQTDPFDEFSSPYVGMGADPVNFTDPTGGSYSYFGAAIGAAVGAAAPYAYEAISGQEVKNKALWAAGGALLGAGIGYGAEHAYFIEGANPSFWRHFASFYAGLIGQTGQIDHMLDADIPEIYNDIAYLFKGRTRDAVAKIAEGIVPKVNDLVGSNIGGIMDTRSPIVVEGSGYKPTKIKLEPKTITFDVNYKEEHVPRFNYWTGHGTLSTTQLAYVDRVVRKINGSAGRLINITITLQTGTLGSNMGLHRFTPGEKDDFEVQVKDWNGEPGTRYDGEDPSFSPIGWGGKYPGRVPPDPMRMLRQQANAMRDLIAARVNFTGLINVNVIRTSGRSRTSVRYTQRQTVTISND